MLEGASDSNHPSQCAFPSKNKVGLTKFSLKWLQHKKEKVRVTYAGISAFNSNDKSIIYHRIYLSMNIKLRYIFGIQYARIMFLAC